MTENRKEEIIDNLESIAEDINNSDDDELTMFRLISKYNKNYNNEELIGGEWVRENIPKFEVLE